MWFFCISERLSALVLKKHGIIKKAIWVEDASFTG